MKNLIQRAIYFAATFLVMTLPTSAGNWYVRPTQQGSNNGTNWNNAWSTSTIAWASVMPGDIIWLAGGTHASGLTIGANGTAGNPILIYRVRSTDAVPVASPGWSSAFDNTVVMGAIEIPHNHDVTIDGRVPFVLSPSLGLTNAGMTISVSMAGGNGIDGSSVAGGLTNITLSNISIIGPYATESNPAGNPGTRGINICNTPNGNIDNLRIHGVSIVGMGESIRASMWMNSVVEYCYIADEDNDGQQHEDVMYSYPPQQNCIWRYNFITNSPNDGVFFEYGGLQNWYFYGNVYYNSGYGMLGAKPDGNTYGPVFVYNNLFLGKPSDVHAVVNYNGAIMDPASRIYNNIFYNVSNSSGTVVSDYNAYNYTSLNGYSWPSGEAHSFTFTGNPFVNIPPDTDPVGSIGDFHLTAAGAALLANKGLALTADGFINKDMDGHTRGSDGTWDVGPYEYGSGGGDTQAPSVPTGLASSNITSTSFTLSWTASTDNVGVTGYEVFKNGASIGTSASASMSVTGLTASTTYAMTVRARDAVPNWSAQSTALNVTTSASGGDTQAPSVPTGLASSNITSTSFTLTWTASTDNVGVTGYEVFKNGASIGTSASASMSVTGLTASTTYSMTVRARDAVPNWSAQSTALIVTTAAAGSSYTVFTNQTPGESDTDGPYEMGMKFQSSQAGQITKIRFYKVSGETAGTHTGRLWSSSGTQLASIAFSGETSSGWQEATLGTPYNITANTTYVVSVNTSTSSTKYGATNSGLASAVTNGPLSTIVGSNGVYGTTVGAFPTTSYQNSNYFRDIVFAPSGSDTQAPSVPTGLTSSNITQTSFTLNWTASTDNVGVTGYEVFKNGASIGTSASASMSVTGLTASTTYSMTVRARDAVPNWSAQSTALIVTTASAGDTQAPSVPTVLTSSSIAQTSFTLNWTASTDNVGVTGYEVFKNGATIGTSATTSMSVTGLTASTTYSMTVRARDAVPNWSAQSTALKVMTASASVTSSTTWQSFTRSTQTGTFTAAFDAVPNTANMNGVTGIQNGTATDYPNLACAVRFYTAGKIEAINGGDGVYSSSTTVNYSAGTSYHFRLVINVTAHTYSIYVTPNGQGEVTLGTNYAFRSQQAGVTQLTGWSLVAGTGTHTVSNMIFGASGKISQAQNNESETGNNADAMPSKPSTFSLSQNYPNPFNPTTNIEYRIANTGFVSLKIYDVLGREVSTLVNGQKSIGIYTVQWDASNLPSGVYFSRLTVQTQAGMPIVMTKKILFTK